MSAASRHFLFLFFPEARTLCLPAEVDLATELGVSRTVIRDALSEMERVTDHGAAHPQLGGKVYLGGQTVG